MKLIIDIPEELVEEEHWYTEEELWTVIKAAENGTPLDIPGIKEKCDNINDIASHFPYPDRRLVQELLSAILGMLKGEST